MKTLAISVDQLDEFMKLQRIELELSISLRNYNEQQTLQLKRLESIKTKAQYLSNFKQGTYNDWYKQLSPELKKVIEKYK